MTPDELLPRDLRARIEALALQTRAPHAGRMQGDRRSPRRGQSVEFADYRPYSRGDDLRRIDWNAYARLERFVVKLFVAEEDLHIHLAVDVSRSMAFGDPPKLATALRLAAALGYLGLVRMDWVSVVPVSDRARPRPPLRGRSGTPELLGRLAPLEAAGSTDLGKALAAYAGVARPGPLLVISDLLDEGWRRGVRAAAGAGFEVTLLHLLAPEEVDPPLEGDLRLLDAETGQAVEVTVDAAALSEYRRRLAEWRDEIQRWAAVRSIPYLALTSDADVGPVMVSALRAQGVVG